MYVVDSQFEMETLFAIPLFVEYYSLFLQAVNSPLEICSRNAMYLINVNP